MRAQNEDWRCLHVARLALEDTAGGGELINTNVIKPSALCVVEGHRQLTIDYNNNALVVKDPTAVNLRSTPKPEADPVPHWVKCQLPADAADDAEFRMPSLVFGKSYEVIGFLMTNSGQLPNALLQPGELIQRKTFPIPAADADLAVAPTTTFEYLRRTGIGSPRIIDLGKEPGNIRELGKAEGKNSLARYPDGIRPLCTELAGPDGKPLVSEKGLPLLLLGPTEFVYQAEHVFRLRPPPTPQKVWERWRRNTTPAYAFDVLDSGITGRNDNTTNRDGEPMDLDVSLDDPAVLPRLYARLIPVFGIAPSVLPQEFEISTLTTAYPHPPPQTPPPGASPQALQDYEDSVAWHEFLLLLADEQRRSDVIKVIRTAQAPGGPRYDATIHTLAVLPGEVWRLDVFTVVEKSAFASGTPMFSDFVLTDSKVKGLCLSLDAAFAEVPDSDPTEVFYAFSPWSLIVEAAATDGMPSPSDLWEALQLNFDSATQSLQVQMDRSLLTQQQWSRIGNIELQRQFWKWHGRPMLSPLDAEWEDEAYALLNDNDFFTEPVPLPFDESQPAGIRTLLNRPLSGDTRCLHHRWSLRAWNRYTPKPADWNSRVAAMPKWQTASVQANNTNGWKWHSILIPSRCPAADPITPPPLKVVLPLTDSWESAVDVSAEVIDSPGLLAVFHGEWFEKHGLAEELQVGIRSNENPGQAGQWFLQYGPDPVLRSVGLPAIDPQQLQEVIGEKGERIYVLGDETVSASVGHIFDRWQVSNPRVQNSSFILRIPTIPSDHFIPATDAGRSEGWRFVQLRFRRRLRAELCADGIERLSEWSPPQWVQMLHGRLAMLPEPGKDLLTSRDLKIRRDHQSWVLERDGTILSAPRLHIHRRGREDAFRFACWLLVTKQIVDAARKPSEAFLGVLQLDDTDPNHARYTAINDLPDLPENGQVSVRFLDVQTRDIAELSTYLRNTTDWWKALSPDNANQDVVARLTNVSPPIDKIMV